LHQKFSNKPMSTRTHSRSATTKFESLDEQKIEKTKPMQFIRGKPELKSTAGKWLAVLRWKSKWCSLGTIYNLMLFGWKAKSFPFLAYPRTTYPCRHSGRLSSIEVRPLDNRFLIWFTLMFTLTFYIWRVRLHCYDLYSFRCESLPFGWMLDIPNSRLNSTDRIAYEFQKTEIGAMNQHITVREAL
jgi:hypothetical protein